jgi:nitric oxide dioxygenase
VFSKELEQLVLIKARKAAYSSAWETTVNIKRPQMESISEEPSNMNSAAKGLCTDLESMIEFAEDGIVSKTLVKTGGSEVSLFCMSAGQSISTHKSSFPAIIHVLHGSGDVTLANKTYQAKPNAWFYMPAQLPHAIEATANLVFLLVLFKRTEKQTQKH